VHEGRDSYHIPYRGLVTKILIVFTLSSCQNKKHNQAFDFLSDS